MQKLSVLFLSLVVLFLFFAGFYLYYVPANKASLNKYGFLVLQQLEASMQYKVKANENLFANYVNLGKASRWLNAFGVDSVLRARHKGAGADTSHGELADRKAMNAGTMQGQLADIRNGRLYYSFQRGTDTVALTIPVTQFMGDLLGTHASDFFQSFLFLKIAGEDVVTIYKSNGLPLGSRIRADSLLTGSKGAFYPGVADLHAGDLDYKLFYIPVTLGNQRFVLCGIKDAGEYAQATHAVPPGFVYPIVITLLLLLIISPLIKLSIMGPAEKVRLRDFTGYCFSLVAGSMLLTLIIIQVLLLKDGDTRQDQHLHQLSEKIDDAFQQELRQAYRQLGAMDSLPLDARGRMPDWRKGNYDVTKQLVAYMQQHRDSAYYNFDRLDWVTDSGRQVINASLDRNLDTLYIDVSKRKYYTDFKNNSCYPLPGIDTALVSVLPVFTWTEGAPRVVLARRSVLRNGIFIVTLSMDMYSLNRTVLPSGYGFCLIDADGRVQVHSGPPSIPSTRISSTRVADAAEMRSAMKARQELYLAGTHFYGREYGLVVKPRAQPALLPRHLL